jgi:hypothetical protein
LDIFYRIKKIEMGNISGHEVTEELDILVMKGKT